MKAGTKLICSKCQILVATSTKDLVKGQKIFAGGWIDPEGKPLPNFNMVFHCRYPLILKGQIHTENGWIKPYET